MMDAQLALKVLAAASTFYGIGLIVAPKKITETGEISLTFDADDEKAMAHYCAGGPLTHLALCIMAHQSDSKEVKQVALCAISTAYAASYMTGHIRRLAANNDLPKTDLITSSVLLGTATCALYKMHSS